MTKASDNLFPKVLIVEGTAPSSPSSGDQALFIDSADHKLKRKNSSGAVTTIESAAASLEVKEIDGSPDVTGVTIIQVTNGKLTDNGGGDVTLDLGGSSGVVDPIFDMFGAPTTAYEFAGTSLSGLTSLNAPSTEDANTTVPGHYYAANGSTANTIFGRYQAATPAFTAIVKIDGGLFTQSNYDHLGSIFIAEASPGKITEFACRYEGGATLGLTTWNTSTSPTTNIGSNQGLLFMTVPYWLAVVVHSSTNVDFLASMDGRFWQTRGVAVNPGYTVGAVGFGLIIQGPADQVAIDYFRIWNSALTFHQITR